MAYAPEQNKTHVERARAKLLGQFRKPRIFALLDSWIRGKQDLEDAAYEVAFTNNIANGFGIILDNIGRLVGRGRDALDDSLYKIGLYTQIRINRAQGHEADFLDVGALSIPGDYTWHFDDYPPASADVWREEAFAAEEIDPVYHNLRQVRGLGIRVDFVALTDSDSVWGLDDDTDGFVWGLDSTAGGAATNGDPWGFDQRLEVSKR